MKKYLKISLIGFAMMSFTACTPNEVLENDNQLNTQSNAIIGGKEVDQHDEAVRHIVMIHNAKEGYICTGTLLGDNFVLTAAHCLSNDMSDSYIYFGNKIVKDSPRLKVNGARAFPNYKPNANHDANDIAILSFEGILPEAFQKVEIYPKKHLNVIRKGTLVLMLGFGITDGATGEGSGVLRHVSARVTNPLFSPTEIMLDQSQGQGTCSGDSGGPVIIFVGSKPYILGITSRGDHRCVVDGIYTSAAVYADWVEQAKADLNQQRRGGRNNPFNRF